MGIFKIIRNTDDGMDYMENAINYVIDGHTDYDKRYSFNTDIDDVIHQFRIVKEYYGKTSGNPVFHFILIFNARTTRGDDLEHTEYICGSIARYFSDKYQIIWGIHEKRMSKKYVGIASVYHAHFVMNSVSYIDGRMFGGSHSEIYAFLDHIKHMTGDNFWIVEYGSNKNKQYEVDENDI